MNTKNLTNGQKFLVSYGIAAIVIDLGRIGFISWSVWRNNQANQRRNRIWNETLGKKRQQEPGDHAWPRPSFLDNRFPVEDVKPMEDQS